MLDKVGFLQEEDEPRPDRVNYYTEAFLLPHNWITLAAAAAFSLVVLSPFPLLAAVGLELIYLSMIPSNIRFQRWVRAHRYVRQQRRDEQKMAVMLKELPPSLRRKYSELNRMCVTIRSNYGELSPTSQLFVEQLKQTLGVLLQAYIRLLSVANQHHTYLRDVPRETILREIQQLEGSLAEEDVELREINRQRIEILNQRLGKCEKIRENARVLDAQCAAIEDVLNLIREQSLSLRDPKQINDELESLVQDVRRTEETVRDVEAIFPAEPGLGSLLPSHGAEVRDVHSQRAHR